MKVIEPAHLDIKEKGWYTRTVFYPRDVEKELMATMTDEDTRPAPLDVRLHLFWRGSLTRDRGGLPPGRGVAMEEMVSAMSVGDPQVIRASLTRLRQGRVRNPADRGTYLPPLPVRWNSRDRLYYDLGSMTPEAVAAQIPGGVLSGAVGDLLTRVATIRSSVGQDGLADSADRLLSDADTRELIRQIPREEIWEVQDHLQAISRARELLALSGGVEQALPAGEETEDENDQ